MKALKILEEKDLRNVNGGGAGDLDVRSNVSALGVEPVRDPRTDQFNAGWAALGATGDREGLLAL